MSLVVSIDELFSETRRKGLLSKHTDWKVVRLGDVVTVQNGFAFKSDLFSSYSENGVPLIRIRDIISQNPQTYYTGQYSDEYIVSVGDLIIGMDGDFNSSIWKGEDGLLNQRVCRLLPDERYLLKSFLAYGIGGYLSEINRVTSSITVKHLSSRDVLDIPFPLPPLAEQNRIVAKLDALMEEVEAAREKLESFPETIKSFRQAILAQAVSGKLTEEWRKENNVDFATWSAVKLKELIDSIEAGKNFSCPSEPVTSDTVGLVKISAVTWGKFDPTETKTVVDPELVDTKLFIRTGDFLFSRANTLELVGASVIVDDIQYRIMLSDKVWRVHFKEEVTKKYINYFFKSKKGRQEIESRASGNQLSMRNISQSSFKDIDVKLPTLKEQEEIVAKVEILFAYAEQLEETHERAKENVDLLPQSILAKAFRGELVPQDPNDEPASVLLERIKEERTKSKAKKQKKNKAKQLSFV